MNLDQALQTFIIEGRELLNEMEAALLRLAGEDEPAESINAIFRAAHTIKGSAGLFGLDAVVAFTHVVESLLDEVREGVVPLDEPLTELLLACGDHIGTLIDAVDAGQRALEPHEAEAGSALLGRLHQHMKPPAAAALVPTLAEAAEVFERMADPDFAAAGGADHWHISLRFGPDVLRNGMDPLSFIRYLATMGQIERIVTLHDGVPLLTTLDAEACCLGFEIAFNSAADKAGIENVFEFVIDDCALRIVPPHSRVAEYIAMIDALPETPARLGEILVRCGSVTAHELDGALRAQSQVNSGKVAAPIGGILSGQVGALLHC